MSLVSGRKLRWLGVGPSGARQTLAMPLQIPDNTNITQMEVDRVTKNIVVITGELGKIVARVFRLYFYILEPFTIILLRCYNHKTVLVSLNFRPKKISKAFLHLETVKEWFGQKRNVMDAVSRLFASPLLRNLKSSPPSRW